MKKVIEEIGELRITLTDLECSSASLFNCEICGKPASDMYSLDFERKYTNAKNNHTGYTGHKAPLSKKGHCACLLQYEQKIIKEEENL